jgi:ankyrin repeat protein
LSHTQFSEWLASKSRLAWIVGKPGSGKSTIASFFVNKLQQPRIGIKAYLPYTEEVSSDALQVRTPKVLSFFCDYYAPPANAVAILWSLLHQLLAEQPSLLRYISPEVRLRCGQRTVQASFLGRLLIHVAEYTDIIVVIDALDECEEPIRDDLLQAFSALENGTEVFQTFPVHGHDVFEDQVLCNPTRSSIKVLITSRPELDIDPSAFVIDLSEKEAAERMAHDIGLVIDAGTDRMRNQGLLLDIQTKLVHQVLRERADGMFLWVELQLKSLESYLRISSDLVKFLQCLPKSLEETYESIFTSIQQKRTARLALRTLQWIVCAARPLSIYELSEAITFEPGYSNILDNCYMKVNIMNLCGNLVEVDTATSTVGLVHRSVREYFMLNDISSAFSSPLFEIPLSNADRAHTQLARCCLAYLTFVSFEEQCTKCVYGRHRKRRKSAEHLRDFPLLSYAAVFWSRHIALTSAKEDDESYGNLVHHLINPKSAPFRIWFPIYWLSQCTETWERKRYPEYPTELIVLAFLGNEKAIRSMFRWKPIILVDECTPAGEEWTPLMAAAWMGNENVVDLLLERGAGYGAQPQQNARTLVAAIERGHIKIAQKLVAHFAKIQPSMTSGHFIFDSSSEGEGATPLLAAIRGGYSDVVVSLVDQGANVNVHGRSNFQAVFPSWVPFWNLEMPSTPIGAAISSGSVEVLNILIDAGADVFGSNSLHVASSLGNMELIKLLVEKGASIDTKYNQDGWSLLHTAAFYGSIDIIRFLLDHGASPKITDKIGRSPVRVACETGNLEVLKLLCENNEASPIEFEDEAAILRLVHYPVKEYLLALRRKPINPQNANSAIKSILTDTISMHPLERAWLSFQPAHESRRLITVAYLLDHGADPFFKDAYGNTFLHYGHYGSIAKLLLDLSPGIDIQNEEGQTALDLAVYFGDADFCQPFLNRKARVSRVTLNNALQSGSHTVVRLLSENITHVPYPKALIRDFSTVKFQLNLQGLGLRENGLTSGGNTPQLKRISPKFERVIDFLDRRQTEHPERIELSNEDNFPFSNAVKSWIEDRSGSAWIWWPLTPRLHPLEPGEVWLKWTCVSYNCDHSLTETTG